MEEPKSNVSGDKVLECSLGESFDHAELAVNILLVLEDVGFSGKHVGAWFVVGSNVDEGKHTPLVQEASGFGENLVTAGLGRFMERIPVGGKHMSDVSFRSCGQQQQYQDSFLHLHDSDKIK